MDGLLAERKRVRMRSGGKIELLSRERERERERKKAKKLHNPEKPHASRKLISFILMWQAPCGRSSWPDAWQRRWCALNKSSGLPDEPYHLQRELCPFSRKLLPSLKQAGVSWLSPYKVKKRKMPVQLALTGSDVNLHPGGRTEVSQGAQERWARLRGG